MLKWEPETTYSVVEAGQRALLALRSSGMRDAEHALLMTCRRAGVSSEVLLQQGVRLTVIKIDATQ